MSTVIEHPEWCQSPCPVEWDGGELYNPHRGPVHTVAVETTEIPVDELAARLYRWPGGQTRIEILVDSGHGRALALLTPATARAFAKLLIRLGGDQ